MSINSAPSAMMLLPVETPVPALHPLVTFHNLICDRKAQAPSRRGRNRGRHLPSRPAACEKPLNAINERLLSSVNVSDLIEAFYYLSHGADVNCCLMDRRTPLYVAASNGYLDLIHLLLSQRGMRVNMFCAHHETALYRAVANQHVNAVRMLLKHGADVNARDAFERTPLHVAVSMDNPYMVELLLEYGAQIHYGADVNTSATMSKRTALHAAAMGNNDEVIRLLLNTGADVNAKNCVGMTPGATARQFNSVAAAEMLEEALWLETKTRTAMTENVAEELDATSQPSRSTWLSRFKHRMTRWRKCMSRFKQRMARFKLSLQRLSPMYCYYW